MTPQERFNLLSSLVASKTRNKEIARKFSLHHTVISNACRALGLLGKNRNSKTAGKEDQIIRAYAAGEKIEAIAALYGVSGATICKIAHGAGFRRHVFAVRKTRSKGVSK